MYIAFVALWYQYILPVTFLEHKQTKTTLFKNDTYILASITQADAMSYDSNIQDRVKNVKFHSSVTQ